MEKENRKKLFKVLRPLEFSGSIHGDYGFIIDGVKSDKGYVSKRGAYEAMLRKLKKDNK